MTALIAALAPAHRPLGDSMAAVYGSTKHLRVEKWIYRSVGANPDKDLGTVVFLTTWPS